MEDSIKKIIIAVAFLCSHLIAFAGEKNSFISVAFGSSFLPNESYKYSGINGGIAYGYRISSQSFGVIGLDVSSRFEGGIRFGYEYDFTVSKGWTPGVNVALLVGVASIEEECNDVFLMKNPPIQIVKCDGKDVIEFPPTLGLGADMGLFLKIGSGKWQGLAQTGVKYLTPIGQPPGEFFDYKFQHYISFALRLSL